MAEIFHNILPTDNIIECDLTCNTTGIRPDGNIEVKINIPKDISVKANYGFLHYGFSSAGIKILYVCHGTDYGEYILHILYNPDKEIIDCSEQTVKSVRELFKLIKKCWIYISTGHNIKTVHLQIYE